MQDGARVQKTQAQFTYIGEANHDLQAADSTKHSRLLINNVNGKTSEEDYWILFETSLGISTEYSEVLYSPILYVTNSDVIVNGYLCFP
jgi:hypothetical protein